MQNNNSIFDFNSIINYCQIVLVQENHPQKMHKLALELLDFEKKMEQLANKLNLYYA